MESINAITTRTISFGPIRPVPATKAVTRDEAGRVTLLPDEFQRSGPQAPSMAYGRDGTGGT